MDQNVAALRAALGWSQARMAEELGISQASVCRIENNDQRPSKAVKKLIDVIVIRHGTSLLADRQPAEGRP